MREVDSNKVGSLQVRNITKNIFEGEVEGLDDRKTGKAIEWPGDGGFSSEEIH
jgi:hypothetical protein